MIDVALSPAELRASDVAVVIDVLRATSTATQALAAGYERVVCADSIERARTLRAPGRVLAGERRCLKPKDFDLGNSPRAVRHRRAPELVLATTNGTPAITSAASCASTVMLACMLNLEAVIDALGPGGRASEATVQIVCAGAEKDVALEDVYLAGRLCAALGGPRTDAARIAEATARAYRTPLRGLRASAHAEVLANAGLASDVAYCSLESTLPVVPFVSAAGAGVAVVAPGQAADGRAEADAGIDRRASVTGMDEGEARGSRPRPEAEPRTQPVV